MDLGALFLQVLGKEDALGGVRQQLCEQALALGKPGPAQIEAVEIEQVERVVEQPVLAARYEIGMQQPEIWDAPRIRDDGFAVQNQVLRRQGCERIGDGAEAPRPVVAPPCVYGRLSASRVRLRAVGTEP